jgi:hypothetical protein
MVLREVTSYHQAGQSRAPLPTGTLFIIASVRQRSRASRARA